MPSKKVAKKIKRKGSIDSLLFRPKSPQKNKKHVGDKSLCFVLGGELFFSKMQVLGSELEQLVLVPL